MASIWFPKAPSLQNKHAQVSGATKKRQFPSQKEVRVQDATDVRSEPPNIHVLEWTFKQGYGFWGVPPQIG